MPIPTHNKSEGDLIMTTWSRDELSKIAETEAIH